MLWTELGSEGSRRGSEDNPLRSLDHGRVLGCFRKIVGYSEALSVGA